MPDAALVVRSSGSLLAVLHPLTPQEQQKARAEEIDGATLARMRRVHFQTVEPGRDYGIELEILDGLGVGEEVAVDPSDAVHEGALVQIAASNAFDVGLATNYLVIQYQTYLPQARSSQVAAKGAYAKAMIALNRATASTLEEYQVAIQEAQIGRVSRPAARIPNP